MYKVIIADDEPLLRFAVRNLLKWEEYGFVVEGEAGDGVEVLEMSRKIKPDLIITDIRMPNMDGLEMIRNLQKESQASVIILSNYEDFSFAQTALRLGVDDYVLKSSLTEENLKKILERERVKFDEERKNRMQDEKAEKKIGSMETVLKKLILQKGDQKCLNTEEKKMLDVLNRPYYVIFVTDYEANYKNHSGEAENLNIMSAGFMENIMGDRLRGRGWYFSMEDAGSGCVVVLPENDFRELQGERLWHSITGLMERYTNRVYLAGISHCGEGAEQLYMFYQESVFAADRYFFNQEHNVISIGMVGELSSDNFRILLDEFFKDAGKVSWITNMPATILKMTEEIKNAPLLSAKCKTILSNALLFYGLKLSGENGERMNNLNDCFAERVHQASTYEAMCREMEVLLEQSKDCVNEMRKYSLPVLQTIQWIRENYREHITLVMAAEQIAIHPNHLSRIFSQQTGRSFSTYLNEFRMEKAQVLLLDRTLTVQDIGDRVGIPNAKYFGDVFKKWCGMSPRDYRQEILQQNDI